MPARLPKLGSWAALTLALAALGCEAQPTEAMKRGYWPEPNAADRALRASLDAWKPGVTHMSLNALSPGVETWDSGRVADRSLRSYEVLGPVGAGEERIYAVKLRFDNPPEEQVIRYLVRGLDPIWVFNVVDYDRIAHWEHPMEEGDPPIDPPDETAAEPRPGTPAGADHNSEPRHHKP